MAEVQAEEASAAEKCCLRVDTLEETVVSLKLHLHVFYFPVPRVKALLQLPGFHSRVCCVLWPLGQRSLARVVQRCPKAEQLGQCVTWEDMQSALLSENLQQVRRGWTSALLVEQVHALSQNHTHARARENPAVSWCHDAQTRPEMKC